MFTTRVVCGVLVSALLLSFAAGWQLHANNRERALKEYEDHLLHAADVLGATLHSELAGAARALRAFAAAAARYGDRDVSRDLLQDEMRCVDGPCFAGLALYKVDGAMQNTAGRPPGVTPAEIRVDPTDATVLGVRTFLSSAAEPSLVLVAPLMANAGDRPRVTGWLAGEVTFQALVRLPKPFLDSTPMEMLVFDHKGNVVFRSEHPEMQRNNVWRQNERCLTCHASLEHAKQMLTMPRGPLRYTVRSTPKVGAVAPFTFEGVRWVVAATTAETRAIQLVALEFRQLFALMLGTLLVLGLTVQAGWTHKRRTIQARAEERRRNDLERSHSELTALNERLENAAMEWRLTVDTIDAALLVLNRDGRIRRMNRAAAETLPGEPFAWIGRPSEDLRTYPPWDAALALARDAVETEAGSSRREHHTAAGRTWDLWCRTAVDGSVVIVARDATALVELQRSLRHSETMAALGSVVVGVAHEVRNPLFGMSSLIDAWSVQPARDPSPFIDGLRRAVDRVNALMRELLEYGRPIAVVLEPAPLSTALDEALHGCAPIAAQRRVSISAEGDVDSLVRIDAHRLSRVFINVMTNAVQHTPTGSSIDVRVTTYPAGDPRYVTVAVRDRGAGFADDDLTRVFTPFFSRRAGGFGLGLALSQRIVAEHRGTIAASNHPEGGGLVTVTLPLVAADSPDRPRS